MKKIAVSLCLTAIASAAFAQGTVNFANSTQTIHTNATAIGGVAGNTAGTAGGFIYEVLTAPSTATALTDANLSQWASLGWTDTQLQGTNTTFASGGRVSGGNGATVQNWAPGVQQNYVIVGWSANEASSWTTLAAKLTDAGFTGTGNGVGYWNTGALLVNGGFIGVTAMGVAQSGGGSTGLPAFGLFGTSASAQGTPISTPTELYVVSTPEPTSMALAGLGIAAGLVLRRRN